MYERPRTTVPVGLLRPGRWCWHLAASAFRQVRQPSTSCSTSLPAQHLWLSGLLSHRPHSLELSPGFYPGPHHQCRLFQTFAKNVFVRSILVHSARLRFSTITALYIYIYISTYLLTYVYIIHAAVLPDWYIISEITQMIATEETCSFVLTSRLLIVMVITFHCCCITHIFIC